MSPPRAVVASEGDAGGFRAKRTFNAGGTMKVERMTMIRIALYTDDERIPAVSPIDAKISPTSPRGTMPTPTSSFDVSDRVTPKPDTSLPMIATTVRIRPTKSTPRSKSALPGMNRRTFTGEIGERRDR